MTKRKLYRSKKDSMLGGVASGLANYFDIDISIVRIIFIVTVFIGGGGILAYIIFWIVIPQEPYITGASAQETKYEEVKETPAEVETKEKKSAQTNMILGIVLILIGLFFVLERMLRSISFHKFWPVLLIIAGFLVIIFSIIKINNNERTNS